MLSINTDISNLKIRRNMNNAVNAVSKALERMSTGYRVNSAKDDAAGLYVASGLTTKIRGLKQAQKNIADGISYLQTGEGCLQNMQNILNRIRDLSVQAANGVYDLSERNAMQMEADSLIEELSRLKKAATFNGKQVFTDNLTTPPSSYSVSSRSLRSVFPRNSAVPLESSALVFNTPSADNPNVIAGAVNFVKGEKKTLEIDGVTYTCTNKNNKDSQISFSKDLSSGVLTLMCNYFEIKGQLDAAHNITMDGMYNHLYTGNLNDTVRDVNRLKGAEYNYFYLGGGDDTAVMSKHQNVHGEAGNDNITINNGTADGGDGDDTIIGTYICSLYGGAGNDYLKFINAENSTLEGGDGDDTVVIQGGKDNWADGGSGTNTVTDMGTNSVLMNFVGVDTKFITLAKKGDSAVINIGGKEYNVTNNGGANNSLVYRLSDDGTVEFMKGAAFTIEAQKDVQHKVLINSTNTIFYSGDKSDNIEIKGQASTVYAGPVRTMSSATHTILPFTVKAVKILLFHICSAVIYMAARMTTQSMQTAVRMLQAETAMIKYMSTAQIWW